MRTCQTSLRAAASTPTPIGSTEDGAVARPGLVVVPRRPGPIRVLGADDARPPDELDAAIDDLFGATTDERPGPFDLALIVGGLALGAWSWLGGGGGLGLASGLVLLMLGIALPARTAVQAIRRRSADAARRRTVSAGYPLDGSSAATADLVDAYEALYVATTLPGIVDPDDALDAAHLALVEVATLLAGAAPSTPAEVDYVEHRTQAIHDLTTDLLAARRARIAATAADDSRLTDARRDRAAALASARDELESVDRLGSLGRLEGLRARLHEASDDGST